MRGSSFLFYVTNKITDNIENSVQKEIISEGKAEVASLKEVHEKEVREKKAELQEEAKKLERRETSLDNRSVNLDKRESNLEQKDLVFNHDIARLTGTVTQDGDNYYLVDGEYKVQIKTSTQADDYDTLISYLGQKINVNVVLSDWHTTAEVFRVIPLRRSDANIEIYEEEPEQPEDPVEETVLCICFAGHEHYVTKAELEETKRKLLELTYGVDYEWVYFYEQPEPGMNLLDFNKETAPKFYEEWLPVLESGDDAAIEEFIMNMYEQDIYRMYVLRNAEDHKAFNRYELLPLQDHSIQPVNTYLPN